MRGLLSLLLAMSACYDVDSLRAGRGTPPDAGPDAPITDAADLDSGDGAPGADAAACPTPSGPDGLVAYYPLDEGAGPRVADCSGHGLDGFVIAGSPQWVGGHSGGGLRVSPSSGCVQLGDATSAAALDFKGAFSVAAWINVSGVPATSGAAGYVAGKTHDPDLGGWRLATGQNGMIGGTVALPTGTRLGVSAPVTLGSWVHVAFVVMPGASEEIYVDGTLAQSASGVPSTLVTDTAASARLGCRSDGTQPFDGVVDEVRVYARALSAAEVASLAR